jgi:predicted 2-oxoglutarate/Fe(II)-dependent dioxygenase YbiX
VFVDETFFDAAACRRVRDAMAQGRLEPAEILDDEIRLQDAVRRTSMIDVDEETIAFVEAAFDGCRDTVAAFHQVTVTDREGAGFLRYDAGGYYRAHRDRATLDVWPGAARRRVALVLFLNDDFDGGALRLLRAGGGRPLTIKPRAGTLVAFDAATLHEVLPVTSGVRETVVDWFLD